MVNEILWFAGGASGAVIVAWVVFRSREATLRAEIRRLEEAVARERERADEKARYAEQIEERLGVTIEAAASRAVKGNNEEFLALAGHTLAPIDEKFRTLETLVRELESARQTAYGSLSEQVKGLLDAQELLRGETGKLVTALARPGVRGRWGEMTLRRVVELAGLNAHCDFTEQPLLDGPDGRQRPDLVVHLPGGTSVAVDAKAPLDAYLAAAEATEESVRQARLDDHAKVLRDHMLSLGRKAYWDQFDHAPDFVVMFVPGEAFVAAAVEQRPDLFEEGFGHQVVLATPSTLMALLRVVAHGWRQETVAESAREVSEIGRELHKRVAKLADHFANLGKRLDGAVGAYNEAVGSLEGRVLPQVRKFEDLAAGSKETVVHLEQIDTRSRELSAPELVDSPDTEEETRQMGATGTTGSP